MFYEIYNEELFFFYKFVKMFERRVEYVVMYVMGIKFNFFLGFKFGMKCKIVEDFYLVMIIFFKEFINMLIWFDFDVWLDIVVGVFFDILLVI